MSTSQPTQPTHNTQKQVLGRGLSALLNASPGANQHAHEGGGTPHQLPLDALVPGALQPRHTFPEEALYDLAVSIEARGVLQPILIRPHPQEKEKYEIVAGERRWRAAALAGLSHVPVVLKHLTDAQALEAGLLENIQRQDLNPVEEAEAYHRLVEEFGHTQETLARVLGKSRGHISNVSRLLALPKKVRDYLVEGKLSAGHGRALIGVENSEHVAEMIIAKDLNVRQTEALVKQGVTKDSGGVSHRQHTPDPEMEILRTHLEDLLDTPVELTLRGQGGKIHIHFKNPLDLDRLIQRLRPPRMAFHDVLS